jgi:hypothetical protein
VSGALGLMSEKQKTHHFSAILYDGTTPDMIF